MSPDQILSTLIYIFFAAYLGSMVWLFVRRTHSGPLVVWGMTFLFASAVWQVSYTLFSTPLGQIDTISLVTMGAIAFLLIPTTSAYLGKPPNLFWGLGVFLFFLIALTVETVTQYQQVTATYPILRFDLTLGRAIALVTWLAIYLFVWVRTFLSYRNASSPSRANRDLFWVSILTLLFLGELAHLWNQPIAVWAGFLIRLSAGFGIVYAAVSYVRFDVRSWIQSTATYLMLLGSVVLPAWGVFAALEQIRSDALGLSIQNQIILSILSATTIIAIYLPVYRAIERFLRSFFGEKEFDASTAIRLYSQAIAGTPEVRQLAAKIFEQLDATFGVSRGALMLISDHEFGYEIEPISASGETAYETRVVSRQSPFIETLNGTEIPLSQYEFDYNPRFSRIQNEARIWLQDLNMELYAPVRSDDGLKGFIALGPKRSGYIYRLDELNVIQLLADQTVAALDNARLYRELGEQNEYVRHLNESLIRQNDRLERMDKAKSDFITIASHELRTPLTQISGYTDILTSLNEEEALTKEQATHILGQVERAAGQLEQLISAMLDASQIDVDEMKLILTQTHVDTIIRLATEPLLQAIKTRSLNLHVEPCQDLPPIQGDFKRLVQAFSNILGNAVKYTPDRGDITISHRVIEHSEDTDYIELAITDTGIGIDPAYHQLIFEKFFRLGDPHLHSTGATKFLGAGPGLGLTIARGVIEGHGGRIWVESEGEEKERLPGSTFYILLPVSGVVSELDGRPAESQRNAAPII